MTRLHLTQIMQNIVGVRSNFNTTLLAFDIFSQIEIIWY